MFTIVMRVSDMRFVLPFALLLAACGTPQERCVDRGTKELQTVETRIAEIRANLDRGYALHQTREPYRHFTWCRNANGKLYHCWETDFRWVEVPVAIDADLEQRKLEALQKRLPMLREEAAETRQSCVAQYPE